MQNSGWTPSTPCARGYPVLAWALLECVRLVSRGGKLGRQSVVELGQPARLEAAVFDGKFGPDGVALAGEFGRSSWASHAADAWDAAKLTGPVRVQTFRRVTG